MASSVVDSRNYGSFPNNAVDVQGTETYTVQQYESRTAGAPVDSRAAGAPVDSRTPDAGSPPTQGPQNSRA